MLRVADLGCTRADNVSILTGPGGPVLRRLGLPHGACSEVSILTGPGGPVLRDRGWGWYDILEFQSSPGPEARCYSKHAGLEVWIGDVSILTGPGGPVLPPRWPTASPSSCVSILTGPGGPVLHGKTYTHVTVILMVSILTGPGGPVLPEFWDFSATVDMGFNPHRARRPGAT